MPATGGAVTKESRRDKGVKVPNAGSTSKGPGEGGKAQRCTGKATAFYARGGASRSYGSSLDGGIDQAQGVNMDVSRRLNEPRKSRKNAQTLTRKRGIKFTKNNLGKRQDINLNKKHV